MKRYLLFIGENYYPDNGWETFDDDFDTIEEAREKAFSYKNNKYGKNKYGGYEHWYQIVDTETKSVCDWL